MQIMSMINCSLKIKVMVNCTLTKNLWVKNRFFLHIFEPTTHHVCQGNERHKTWKSIKKFYYKTYLNNANNGGYAIIHITDQMIQVKAKEKQTKSKKNRKNKM
jgi:hypothetical protein